MSAQNETFQYKQEQLSLAAFFTLLERADDRLVVGLLLIPVIYGIIANIALVIAVLGSRELRQNPSYYLLVQIAFCDLILLFFDIFLRLAGIVFRQAYLISRFSTLNSTLYFFSQCGWWIFVCSLTVTAANRFVCIFFVGRYDTFFTQRSMLLAVLLTSLVGIAMSIPHLTPCCRVLWLFDEWTNTFYPIPTWYIPFDNVVTFTTIGIIVLSYMGVIWRVRQKQTTATGKKGRDDLRIALQVGLMCGIYIINSVLWNIVPYIAASKWTNAAFTATTPIQCATHPTIAFLFNSRIRKELQAAVNSSHRQPRASISQAASASRSMFKEVLCKWTIPARKEDRKSDFSQESPVFFAAGLPWSFDVSIEHTPEDDSRKFAFVLRCNEDRTKDREDPTAYCWADPEEGPKWNCEHFTTLTIVNSDKAQNVAIEFDADFPCRDEDVTRFHSADKLYNDQGFINDEVITFEARVNVKYIFPERKPLEFDFTGPGIGADDVVLVVEGKKVHVSRHYLAMHSPYFEALFFREFDEKNKEEIELPDVKYDPFIELLYVIYPSYRPVTWYSAPFILDLADRFNIKYAIEQAEKCLLAERKSRADSIKLFLADRYRLPALKVHCLQRLSHPNAFKELQETPEYEKLSNDIKAKMLDILIECSNRVCEFYERTSI